MQDKCEVGAGMKKERSKEIPINDPRVLPILLKAVDECCEAMKKCKTDYSYLYTKSNHKTTVR